LPKVAAESSSPTAQGLTNRGHISALHAGSQTIDGLLGFSAHTRHTQKLWRVSSESAEQIAVRESRALNDTRPITTEDKWAQLARVLSYQPERTQRSISSNACPRSGAAPY
jgi:hypothetical protein